MTTVLSPPELSRISITRAWVVLQLVHGLFEQKAGAGIVVETVDPEIADRHALARRQPLPAHARMFRRPQAALPARISHIAPDPVAALDRQAGQAGRGRAVDSGTDQPITGADARAMRIGQGRNVDHDPVLADIDRVDGETQLRRGRAAGRQDVQDAKPSHVAQQRVGRPQEGFVRNGPPRPPPKTAPSEELRPSPRRGTADHRKRFRCAGLSALASGA